jgi:hypothetical protein
MPPKKSGKRHQQGESKTSKKNNAFFDDYISDLRKDGKVDDIYISRVIRVLGNGLVSVFYISKSGAYVVKAYIRGVFRGKGKHSVDISDNSIVLIADTGISGPAQFEIMALLSPEHISELRKVTEIDPRIVKSKSTDGDDLIKNKADPDDDCGFEFTNEEQVEVHVAEVGEQESDDEVDVDAI